MVVPGQAYVSRARMESFSLTADMMYVSTNAPRICRALFEICLRRGWGTAADLALTMCKVRARALPTCCARQRQQGPFMHQKKVGCRVAAGCRHTGE